MISLPYIDKDPHPLILDIPQFDQKNDPKNQIWMKQCSENSNFQKQKLNN